MTSGNLCAPVSSSVIIQLLHGLGRFDEIMQELALGAPGLGYVTPPAPEEVAIVTVLVLLLLPTVSASFPAPSGLPQAPAESSLSPPESEGDSPAQPEKNTGLVPAHDATNREPTRQAAPQESESEEAGGAGKWGWPQRGSGARGPAWCLALGDPHDTTLPHQEGPRQVCRPS